MLALSEQVQVVGVYSLNKIALRANVTISFDANGAQPNEMSPAMAVIVLQELQHSVQRILDKAKKIPRESVVALPGKPLEKKAKKLK